MNGFCRRHRHLHFALNGHTRVLQLLSSGSAESGLDSHVLGPLKPSVRALEHISVDLDYSCFSKGVLEGWIENVVFPVLRLGGDVLLSFDVFVCFFFFNCCYSEGILLENRVLCQ